MPREYEHTYGRINKNGYKPDKAHIPKEIELKMKPRIALSSVRLMTQASRWLMRAMV